MSLGVYSEETGKFNDDIRYNVNAGDQYGYNSLYSLTNNFNRDDASIVEDILVLEISEDYLFFTNLTAEDCFILDNEIFITTYKLTIKNGINASFILYGIIDFIINETIPRFEVENLDQMMDDGLEIIVNSTLFDIDIDMSMANVPYEDYNDQVLLIFDDPIYYTDEVKCNITFCQYEPNSDVVEWNNMNSFTQMERITNNVTQDISSIFEIVNVCTPVDIPFSELFIDDMISTYIDLLTQLTVDLMSGFSYSVGSGSGNQFNVPNNNGVKLSLYNDFELTDTNNVAYVVRFYGSFELTYDSNHIILSNDLIYGFNCNFTSDSVELYNGDFSQEYEILTIRVFEDSIYSNIPPSLSIWVILGLIIGYLGIIVGVILITLKSRCLNPKFAPNFMCKV